MSEDILLRGKGNEKNRQNNTDKLLQMAIFSLLLHLYTFFFLFFVTSVPVHSFLNVSPLVFYISKIHRRTVLYSIYVISSHLLYLHTFHTGHDQPMFFFTNFTIV